ncbi:MAG: hypothetical protein WC758_00410 [Candidatus Woesearchaeota archaeon]|jgi:hypothetical protein
MNALQFINTDGHNLAKLIINRREMVDLFPLFREAFKSVYSMTSIDYSRNSNPEIAHGAFKQKIQDIQNNSTWKLSEDTASLEFTVEDFFKAFLHSYSKEDVVNFINENLVDKNDFYAFFLVNRILHFDELYLKMSIIHGGYADCRVFSIYAPNGPSPSELESIIPYVTKGKMKWYLELNSNEHFRGKITEPYDSNYAEHVEDILYASTKNFQRTLLRMPQSKGLLPNKLNLFNIITYYNLPTENLNIVKKTHE